MTTYTRVTLYKSCILTEEKNFIVEGLSFALDNNYSGIRGSSEDSKLVFTNVQYQKIKLNMTLKLVGNETFETQTINTHSNYNYAVITQYLYKDDGTLDEFDDYYFFVKNNNKQVFLFFYIF